MILEDDRWVITYEVVENLVSDHLHHLKGCRGLYRVDQDIAMDTDEVLRVQDAVLILRFVSALISPMFSNREAYLTGGINNLSCKVLSLVLDDLAESVLNRRIITLHKVTINKLHRQRRLSYASHVLISLITDTVAHHNKSLSRLHERDHHRGSGRNRAEE